MKKIEIIYNNNNYSSFLYDLYFLENSRKKRYILI